MSLRRLSLSVVMSLIAIVSLSQVRHVRQDETTGNNRFSTSAYMERMETTPLHHIEGVWRFTAGGAEIGILRPAGSKPGSTVYDYEIVLLSAPNRALRPGTVIGTVRPSAKASTYQAKLYTRSVGSKLFDSRTFMLRLDTDDNRIVFERKKSNVSVNLWRLLPYLWRLPIEKRREPTATEGCVRIYPQPETPLEPRYL